MNKNRFQFKNPELEKVSFVVNQEYNEQFFEGISMESKTEVKVLDEVNAYVVLTLHIGEEGEKQPFDIVIRMSAEFFWEESLEESTVKVLLKSNAPAALLSYIRPLVSMITMSSKYPALNLPFMDFTKNEVEDVQE